jgi:hypothetical protein
MPLSEYDGNEKFGRVIRLLLLLPPRATIDVDAESSDTSVGLLVGSGIGINAGIGGRNGDDDLGINCWWDDFDSFAVVVEDDDGSLPFLFKKSS